MTERVGGEETMTLSEPPRRFARALVIGASLTSGPGYAGVPFGQMAASALASEILDLSFSGQTTSNLLSCAEQIWDFRPELVIAEVGFTEAMIHPGRRVQRLIERYAPDSWHGVAGLEPRARYSTKSSRRLRQMANSHAKVWIKRLLFDVLSQGEPLVPLPVSMAETQDFLAVLDQTPAHVVLLGVPAVDGRLFPGTDVSVERWNQIMRGLAPQLRDAQFVPLRQAVRQWDDYLADRLHLNASGHEHAAAAVVDAVRRHRGRPGAPSVADST